MRKYEMALLYESYNYEKASIIVEEYNNIEFMQYDLKEILKYTDNNLYKIELSILEQDENGENINCWTFCEINVREYLKGKNNGI